MPIINRLTSLFNADVHAILDRLEDPYSLLRQAVREMEDALTNQEIRINQFKTESESLLRRLAETEKRNIALDEELDVCFSSSEEELAKTVVRRKLECDLAVAALKQKHAELKEMQTTEESRYQEQRRQLASTQEKLEIIELTNTTKTDLKHSRAPGFFDDIISGAPISSEAVEVAFLKEKQRRGQV